MPRWWVIPSPVFEAMLSPLRAKIQDLLVDIQFRDQTSLEQASARIRRLILEVEVGRNPRRFRGGP